jgi:hypothetical protein
MKPRSASPLSAKSADNVEAYGKRAEVTLALAASEHPHGSTALNNHWSECPQPSDPRRLGVSSLCGDHGAALLLAQTHLSVAA